MLKDTSKIAAPSQESDLEFHSVQAELERTRAILRETVHALLDSGCEFIRDTPLSQWWQEDMRRPKVEA